MVASAPRRRWFIPALLFFVSAASYLDRQTLSVLSATLRHKLGLTSVEYGGVVSGFLAAYGCGFCFSGRLIDRYGVKRTLAWALTGWSIVSMLHAFATGWRSLLVLRLLLGLGESFATPAAAKVLVEWIPRQERAFCTSIFSTGNFVGAMIAPSLVAGLTLRFHWSLSFLVTGSAGLGLVILWLVLYRPPEEHPLLSPEERAYILSQRGSNPVRFGKVSTLRLLAHPAALGFFCTRFFTDSFSYFFVFWLPLYLQTSRAFTLAAIGLFAWIPYLGADFGTLGGGAISDWLVRRGWPVRRARLGPMFAAACLTPLTLVAVRLPSAAAALALIAVVMAAQASWNNNLFTLTQETAPPEHVASVVAVSILGGTVGGSLSSIFVGSFIRSAGYVAVFTGLGFVHLLGFGIVTFALRRADARPVPQ